MGEQASAPNIAAGIIRAEQASLKYDVGEAGHYAVSFRALTRY